MSEWIYTLVGCLAGAIAATVVVLALRRREDARAGQLRQDMEKSKADDLAFLVEQLKTSFAALSRDALSSNTDDFLKLASTRLAGQTAEGEKNLESKKKLIDARLEEMGHRLQTLNSLIQNVEKQRAEAQGALGSQLEKATQATNRLHETTAQLREALANPQRRGQWGERMAEDVLRLAGFLEGVNYVKQQQVGGGTRPDFTFPLPGNRVLHMDVKFPLANYLRTLDADDETARAVHAAQFLKDVRARVREVTGREYIDPARGTVDYVLVFIPNEQVFGFIHEQDSGLLDDALRRKVVLCSPMTLYSILAIIRQSAENFRLEQNATQILNLLAAFRKHWDKYVDSMDALGKRLDAAVNEYQHLSTTRTRQLDRQLDRIDDLRAAGADDAVGGPGDDHLPRLPMSADA